MNLSTELVINLSSLLMAAAAFSLAIRLGPFWDQITARQIRDLSPRMEDLRLDLSELPRYLRWWGIAMLVTFVFFFVRGMLPVAITAVYLIYISPRLLLNSWIRKRSYLLRDQMVGACVALANATRAGLNLAQGLESVAEESPAPLSIELKRIVHDYNRGRLLSEAITQAKDRLKLDSFTLFASAILVTHERGGRITDALERISVSLQENQRLERKIEADTESGRKVALILGAFPFLFLAVFSFLEPEGVGLMFSTTIGQLIFVTVTVLVYVSLRWCNKILAIEV